MADVTLTFIDVETTGLNPRDHRIWEVGLIRRSLGGQELRYHARWWPDKFDRADANALRINRFWGRCPSPGTATVERLPPGADDWHVVDDTSVGSIAMDIAALTAGSWLAGSSPWFDARFLEEMLRRYGVAPAWHHRMVAVKSFAYAALHTAGVIDDGQPPWNPDDLIVALDLPDMWDRHSAFGDASWARAIYDAAVELRDMAAER